MTSTSLAKVRSAARAASSQQAQVKRNWERHSKAKYVGIPGQNPMCYGPSLKSARRGPLILSNVYMASCLHAWKLRTPLSTHSDGENGPNEAIATLPQVHAFFSRKPTGKELLD